MKNLRRILVWLAIVILFSFLSLSFYLQVYGWDFIQIVARQTLKRDIAFESVVYDPPLGFSVRNIVVDESFRIKRLDIQFALSSILERKVNIRALKLIHPTLEIHTRPKIFSSQSPDHAFDPDKQNPTDSKPSLIDPSAASASMVIQRFMVDEGAVNYHENIFGQKISFLIDRINFQMTDLTIPLQAQEISFDFSGRLRPVGVLLADHMIQGKGWLNILKKDMVAAIKILDNNQDEVILAYVESKDNHMVVSGDMMTKDLAQGLIKKMPNLETLVVQKIGVDDFGLVLKFSFETAMDDFRLGTLKFLGYVDDKSG